MYQKVLFKPGLSVSADELNDLQSILKKRIKTFADHIFQNGSIVSNCRTSIREVSYVQMENPVPIADYKNMIIRGESGLEAVIVEFKPDEDKFFIVILKIANDGETIKFVRTENIEIKNFLGETVHENTVIDEATATGRGLIFTVDSGTLYVDGTFVDVAAQSLILNSVSPIYEDGKIGFAVHNDEIDFTDDNTLLDPAIGFSSSLAPGADREKIELFLIQYPLDESVGDDFVLLAKVINSEVHYQKSEAEYSKIDEVFSKRHFEQSGNYTLFDFEIEDTLNHKKEDYNDPNGYDLAGFEGKYAIILSPGTAYVHGERIVKRNKSIIIVDETTEMPRKDMILMDKYGTVYLKKGIPGTPPVPRRPDSFTIPLFEVSVNANSQFLSDIKITKIDNKRYTMRDIGRLENRIENAEYYTSLNFLDKSTAELSIKDANGLDRFKNGFVTDNFEEWQAADLGNFEFRAALNRYKGELRPQFKTNNWNVVFNEKKSLNCRYHRASEVVSLPYINEKFDESPYSTKHISINPYLQFLKEGAVILSPDVDTWSDDTIKPKVTSNIDNTEAFQQLASAAGVLGTQWGSWTNQNKTIIQGGPKSGSSTTGSSAVAITQVRTGIERTIETNTQEYHIADIMTDVSILPYMREIEIEFSANGMKANTKIYAFFEESGIVNPISQFCIQRDNNPLGGKVKGDQLVTDEFGIIRGIFEVPAGRFFTGQKKFFLSNDPSGRRNEDIETTYAEAPFFAGGLNRNIESHSLNVTTATINEVELKETQKIIKPGKKKVPPAPPPAPPPPLLPPPKCTRNLGEWLSCRGLPDPWHSEISTYTRDPKIVNAFRTASINNPGWQGSGTDGKLALKVVKEAIASLGLTINNGNCPSLCLDQPIIDPIAQAFLIEEDCFLSAIDLFLQNLDENSDSIWFEIRTMVNGYPSNTEVLYHKTYIIEDLLQQNITSDNGSMAWHIEFDTPVYVEKDTEYCFVVGGYSPDTRIWVAKIGEPRMDDPTKIIETSPTFMSSFRSINASTWNAEQTETISYFLYRARFQETEMELVLDNAEKQNEKRIEDSPFEMQAGENKVRVFAPNHGFVPGDVVEFDLFRDVWHLVEVRDTVNVPQKHQKITTSGTSPSSGIIVNVERGESERQFYLQIKNIQGKFKEADEFIVDADVYIPTHTSLLVSREANPSNEEIQYNFVYGKFLNNDHLNKYDHELINGVPVEKFTRGHTIITVNSLDSFIIQLDDVGLKSGRFGGPEIYLTSYNEKYELFNASASYLTYGINENWTFRGLGHAAEEADYLLQKPINFEMGSDTPLEQPYKLVGLLNQNRKLSGKDHKSFQIRGKFTSDNTLLSPVVKLNSFSLTTVSNRVGWQTEEELNIIPNEDGRFISEESPLSGTESYKYLTKDIFLQNPAEDIQIYLDVYKDINADFDIYIKRLLQWEDKTLEQLPWMRMENIQKIDNDDFSDRHEYKMRASDHIPNWNHELTEDEIFDLQNAGKPFSAFKVKIVGKARNTAKPPIFKNLRAIAIT